MASHIIDDTFRHQSHVLSEEPQHEGGYGSSNDTKDDDIACGKKTGHNNRFINVTDFQKTLLPPSCHSDTCFMDYLHNAIDRTVNVQISFTSNHRPDTNPNSEVPYPFVGYRGSKTVQRCGTGYLEEFCDFKETLEDPCLCKYCTTSKQVVHKRWEFKLSTSTHLVWDKYEAQSTVFELYYDSEDRENVKYLYGVDIVGDENERYTTDYSQVICVTHDEELGNKLKHFCDITAKISLPNDCGNWNSSTGILISHPHGTCKKISIGNIYHRCLVRHPKATPMILHKGRYCRLPTGRRGHEREDEMQKWEPQKGNNSKYEFSNANDNYYTCNQEQRNKMREVLFDNRHILEKPSEGEVDLAQLAIDVKVILPEKSKHHMCRSIKDDSMHWYVFPPNTRFLTLDGTTEIPFPSNMEFHMPNVQAAYTDDRRCNCWYVTYDMASSPGSSGARVLDLFRHNRHQSFHHYGTYPQYKVSGLIRGYYFVPRVCDLDS